MNPIAQAALSSVLLLRLVAAPALAQFSETLGMTAPAEPGPSVVITRAEI